MILILTGKNDNKMKYSYLFIGIAAALVVSCSVHEEEFNEPIQDDVEFYTSFEQPTEGTRVYVNEDLLLRWNADDRVSIFNKNTYNQQYRFTGETGDNAGGFKKVDSDEFVTGNALANVVSVYPYQEVTKITEAGTLSLILPSEQHYAENTFGLGANTMVSVSSDNFLQYKNVGGYLRLSLYGEGVKVSSITLRGNNGEKLAGKATVTMPLDGMPTVTLASDATDAIILVCDTPVALGATAEESKDFWFVVPPVTFSQGFTVSVNQTTGGVFEKSTSKNITIGRNILSKMSPIEVEGSTPTVPVPEAVDLGLPSGLKWASFNLGASKPEEYGDHYAWGETEPYYSSLDPLTWNEGKEEGYAWTTYQWCMGSKDTMTKYCSNPFYGYNDFTDNKTVLDSEDDAAHVKLGSKWRMPTYAEWTELMKNCTWEWTTLDSAKGYTVTGPNGCSIFVPAAGRWFNTEFNYASSYGDYWSSSLNSPDRAMVADFKSVTVDGAFGNRYLGLSVRPVYGEFVFVESVSLNTTSLSLLEGTTEQLTVTILPSDATEKTVKWTSNDTSVASVSWNGEVTAVSAGTATITAWASDGVHSTTCSVIVTAPYTVVTPEAIDLGLPSGLKWASFNLGATSPEEYGDYFAWGEVTPKANYSWSTYKYCDGSSNSMTKYCLDSSYGQVDGLSLLESQDDAASINLGEDWRMPTKEEWTELMNDCSWVWTTVNGKEGYLITGKKAGFTENSIFLPAAGIWDGTSFYPKNNSPWSVAGSYWSSNLGNTNIPYNLDFDIVCPYVDSNSDEYRYTGQSIRPVWNGGSIPMNPVIDLSKDGTANCYIVSTSGSYKFNATVKGNSLESLRPAVSAEVMWESFGTNIAPETGDIIASVELSSDGYVLFATPEELKDGNALIAIKDAVGTVLWSWHIWVCKDFDPEKTASLYANNAGVMMDRNLGALSATPGDNLSIGLLYQWGRKDPFMGSSSLTNTALAAATPAFPTPNATTTTIEYTIEHPSEFIAFQSFDWLNSTNDNRWKEEKTIYDPCPPGWKVPQGGPDGFYATAFGTSKSISNHNYWDSSLHGLLLPSSISGVEAWYPASGARGWGDARLVNVGSIVEVYSSLVGQNSSAYTLNCKESIIYPSSYCTSSSATDYFHRVDARSVRCVRED